MTTTIARPLLAAVLFSTALCACAQVPPPAPGPAALSPPQAPVGAPPLPAPPASVAGVQRLDGIVKTYLVNEFGDVDGFIARDNTAVRFPPHMSADLVSAFRPGDHFVAQGAVEAWGRFRAFSLAKVGTDVVLNESRPSVAPLPPVPPNTRAAALVPMRVEGTVASVLYAPRGEVEGVVLSDGTVLRLSPGASVAVRAGARVVANGYGTRNAYGRGLRVDALTIDGQVVATVPTPGQPLPPPAPPVPPATPFPGAS